MTPSNRLYLALLRLVIVVGVLALVVFASMLGSRIDRGMGYD
jgi:hypothetical protein